MLKSHLSSFFEEVQRQVTLEESRALSDAELLDRFVLRQNTAAFAALVQRHGPMVLGVCRRLLKRAEDAEDASQAVFLVLARKAASIHRREALPAWLHAVACRVARKARAGILRTSRREVPMAEMPQADVKDEVSWREALAILDEELNRLPANYRAPLVLCYLEGKTQDVAARELGWSLGAFRGRLERARERLRTRVVRRGVTLPALFLGAGLGVGTARAGASGFYVTATTDAATCFAAGNATTSAAAARVVALANGVISTMRVMKLWTAALVVAASLGLVAGTMALRQVLRPDPEAVAQDAPAAPEPGKPTWQPRATIGGHFGWSCYVEIAGGGKTLGSFNPSTSELTFWDTATWKQKGAYPLKKVFTGGGSYCIPLFSRDGAAAVVEGQNAGKDGRAGAAVALLDVAGGKVRGILPGGMPTFSKDGKLLAVGREGAVAVYDVATAKDRVSIGVKGDWRKGVSPCHHVWFSPDGKSLVTSRDGVVKLWETATGKERATIPGYLPTYTFETPPFSRDGKTLLTADKTRRVKLWDVATGKERATVQGHELPYVYALFSPDGKTLATLGTWNGAAAGARPQRFTAAESARRPVEVKLWDLATGKALVTLPGTTFGEDRAAFSPDGKTLAYRRAVPGEEAHCVALWDLAAGKELTTIPGDHVGSFSPDGKLLMTQSPGGGVTFRDARTGKVASAVRGNPERQVSFLSLSPDWRLLVTSAFFVGKRGQGKPGERPWEKVETRITVYEFADRPVKTEALGGPKETGGANPGPVTAAPRAQGAAGPGPTWQALKQEIEGTETDLATRRRAAKTDEELQALGNEIYRARERFAARALDQAREHPQGPVAVEALEYALRSTAAAPGGRLGELNAEAVRLVGADHLKSPSLDRLLPWLAAQSSEAGEALLGRAAEESPHRVVRGRAASWLARVLAGHAEKAHFVRQAPELAEVGFKGQPEYLKRLRRIDPDKATARAEELFERLRKDYPDVKQYDHKAATLGEVAERGLFALRNLAVGKEAPEIAGEELGGKSMKLRDARGKVVVLVFCGYWCGPCRAMMPHERELVRRFATRPFELFWVNGDKDRLLTKERMEKDGNRWRSWWDGGSPEGPIATRWNVDGFPTVFVLDAKGVIRFKAFSDPGTVLDRIAESLLKEAEGSPK